MDYEEMIEDENEPTEPVPEDELEESLADQREKSPWKAFILTGVIASLFGVAGGGYGVYEGMKRLGPKVSAQSTIDISPLEAKVGALSERMSAAEASVKKAANRPMPKPAPKIESVDLSGIETRLDALESAPRPEIDPAALTALQSAQADGFEWPDTSDLEGRLAALELNVENAPEPSELPTDIMERLDALELELQNVPTSGSQPQILDTELMDEIEARIAALESRPTPKSRIERVSILAFPKTAMVEAADNAVEGGLFKKALSKHVRVKDDDDPLTLIDAIEADIAQGRLEDAVKTYNRLPEPVRAAGQAWYDSVKASL